MLYFSHYLTNSFKFTADEIMSNVQHQFQEVKMDFKSRNSSKKKLHTSESLFIWALLNITVVRLKPSSIWDYNTGNLYTTTAGKMAHNASHY